MANNYLAGSLVRVATYTGTISTPTGGFRDDTGALADPGIVTLQYRESETGELVTVTYPASPIVRDATGLYHADLDTTDSAAATWSYGWTGYGGVQAVAASSFVVRPLFP